MHGANLFVFLQILFLWCVYLRLRFAFLWCVYLRLRDPTFLTPERRGGAGQIPPLLSGNAPLAL